MPASVLRLRSRLVSAWSCTALERRTEAGRRDYARYQSATHHESMTCLYTMSPALARMGTYYGHGNPLDPAGDVLSINLSVHGRLNVTTPPASLPLRALLASVKSGRERVMFRVRVLETGGAFVLGTFELSLLIGIGRSTLHLHRINQPWVIMSID
ncbi:hypothetical protein OsI_30434 [Oryza sativa Indica Group]|uniref:Uncharacterized protein n=1 Tax=Oryza sativa subsp. indica TaxID=39946 RepID=B8BD03_ORYSI|nr:hypothetical protein OsI_30434 [Oryza sativa Indica Group]